MDRGALAVNLAQGLCSGGWSAPEVGAILARRLPGAARRLAPRIASELVTAAPGPYAPTARITRAVLQRCESFERLYRWCNRNDIWPAPDLSRPSMAPVAAFARLDLPGLATQKALADWLLLPPERLDYLSDPASRHERHGDFAVNHYAYVLHRKTHGGLRLVEAPKPTLKSLQRQILRGILNRVPPHDDAFGFVRGRNCRGAARRHAGEQVVICFDLKDFFPSIGAGRVFGLFRCLGYPQPVARHLTGLCTNTSPSRITDRLPPPDRPMYRRPHLPQGAPCSPALANLAAFGLDRRLSGLARSLGAGFSRYADDLAFSGDRDIAAPLLRLVPDIIRDEGFVPNPAKTRVMSETTRQQVTGVVVNRHLNVPRARYDRLKSAIHACRQGAAPDRLAEIEGEIAWVEAVNPPRGAKLRRLLTRALSAP